MWAEHNSQMFLVLSQIFILFSGKRTLLAAKTAGLNKQIFQWWIYSLSLTTEISNNLSQMPSAILDITPALYSTAPLRTS